MADVKGQGHVAASDSYQSRAGADCCMLGELEEQPCWGVVRYSSHGVYLCEGHSTPPDYRVEPVPLSNEAVRQLIEEREQVTAREAAEREKAYQAGRWFRPLLELGLDDVGVGLFWTDVSDLMLTFLHSIIGDGLQCGDGNEAVNTALMAVGHQATAEVHRRGLDWPNGCYQLQLAPEVDGYISPGLPGGKEYHEPFGEKVLELHLHHLSDRALHLLYGCAAVVVDFSGLERGTRQCSMHVYAAMGNELARRGEGETLLMDLDWEMPGA